MIEEPGLLRGSEFVSSRALDERSMRAATALRAAGVGPGDTVALLLRNGIAFFEAAFGATVAGAAPVPLNWHGKPDEVQYVLRDCRARVLVAHADLLRPLLGALPEGLQVRVVATPPDIADAYGVPGPERAVPAGMTEWQAWIAEFGPWAGPPLAAPAGVMYSSGTTGKPKGVRRPSVTPAMREGSAYYAAIARISGFQPGLRAVVTGPLYHGAPLAWAMGWVRMNGFVVFQPRFDAEDLLRIIDEQRISHLFLVPIMFTRLLKLPDEVRRRYDTSSVRHVTHGGAPCPRHVKEQMIGWWGPVLYEQYGSLETGLVTGTTSEEWLAHPGTVGRPTPGSEIRILDEDGKEVPVGTTGEICTRVGDQPDFTYQRPDEAADEVSQDGFVASGDVGYFDADGFLYLADRKKDMVISGGVNIFPAEIEECLLTLPGVRDAAAFGIPDDEYGESLAAAVELDGSAPVTADDVRAHVRAHLAAYKAPRVVEFRSEIPRLESGKILKRKLREAYWAQSGRAI